MPELPEVETTAAILNKLISNQKIVSVWTDYNSPYFYGKENIKDPKYFKKFKVAVCGKKIIRVWRRAKNVLIDISGDQTILIHMKMTGHLLYGKYKYEKRWKPVDEKGPLSDPFNRFIHLIFELDNGRSIAFSDMRKFATVKLIRDEKAFEKEFAPIGPEPLDKNFKISNFKKLMSDISNQKPKALIKTVLMDPTTIAGIGNIYSDEILWASRILPDRKIEKVSDPEWSAIFKNMKKFLARGIDFGGDSMSDYRNPYGLPGKFQTQHNVYQRKNKDCKRCDCKGKIKRKIIGARSAHFCPECQK